MHSSRSNLRDQAINELKKKEHYDDEDAKIESSSMSDKVIGEAEGVEDGIKFINKSHASQHSDLSMVRKSL